MGLIDRILGGAPAVTAMGSAVTGVAEVFTRNKTRQMELDEQAYGQALAQFGQEYQRASGGWFDNFINGLNRLPRPVLALGTIGLFIYAMIEPYGFGRRMLGLQQVPEPLWWLLGAIVGFYFGAREAHYFRYRRPVQPALTLGNMPGERALADDFADNAALRDWAATGRGKM